MEAMLIEKAKKEVRSQIGKGQLDVAERMIKHGSDGWVRLVLMAEVLIARMRQPRITGRHKLAFWNRARKLCMKALFLYKDQNRPDIYECLSKLNSAWGSGPRDMPSGQRPKEEQVVRKFYTGDPGTRKPGPSLGEKSLKALTKLGGAFWPLRAIGAEEYFIKFLKVFSSYTPLAASGDAAQHGGGYFACFGGYGCVIDPGHHFLDNFFRDGHSIHDIDAVIITHFHDDHYADFLALLSLLYQRSKPAKRCDSGENTTPVDPAKKRAHRLAKVDFYMDSTSYKMFGSLLRSVHGYRRKVKYCRRLIKLVPEKGLINIVAGVTLQPIPTHHKVLGRHTGVGLLFQLKHRRKQLLITGDTAWKGGVPAAYRVLTAKGLVDDCVLVAHVSTAYVKEPMGLLYRNHLSIRGLCRVIETTRPKHVILSEIGEELKDAIQGLRKIISDVYGCECHVGWIKQNLKDTSRGIPFVYDL